MEAVLLTILGILFVGLIFGVRSFRHDIDFFCFHNAYCFNDSDILSKNWSRVMLFFMQ